MTTATWSPLAQTRATQAMARLRAQRLLRDLDRLGANVRLSEDGKLLVKAVDGLTDEVKERIKASRDGMVDLLKREGGEPWQQEEAERLLETAKERRTAVGYHKDRIKEQFRLEDKIDTAWLAQDMFQLRQACQSYLLQFPEGNR